jgi:hypothetical protein
MARIFFSEAGRHPAISGAKRKIIMRSSIKRSLAGLLVVGALALGASGAYAMGGAGSNSADAFIGIVGGNPGYYLGGGSYNNGPFNPGYDSGDASRNGHHSYGGNGGYDGGSYHGY